MTAGVCKIVIFTEICAHALRPKRLLGSPNWPYLTAVWPDHADGIATIFLLLGARPQEASMDSINLASKSTS